MRLSLLLAVISYSSRSSFFGLLEVLYQKAKGGRLNRPPLFFRCNHQRFWKHEKNGPKNMHWILGRIDGENTYDFWSSKPSKNSGKSKVPGIGGSIKHIRHSCISSQSGKSSFPSLGKGFENKRRAGLYVPPFCSLLSLSHRIQVSFHVTG